MTIGKLPIAQRYFRVSSLLFFLIFTFNMRGTVCNIFCDDNNKLLMAGITQAFRPELGIVCNPPITVRYPLSVHPSRLRTRMHARSR